MRIPLYLGIVAPLLMLLSACTEPESNLPRQSPTINVVVEPVQFSTERTRVEAVGTSRAIRSITVHPATSGEVIAVHFEPGQLVEEGDVLVELDSRDEKLAVELGEVRLQDARRLYDRYVKSADSGATLPTTLDAAQTALESARIELDRAKVALADRTIRAPFTGYVGLTDIDAGDRIQPTTAITTLDDRGFLLVSFDVPELIMGKLEVGSAVEISTWNADATRARGEIINIDSRIDPQTRTFVARARVDNNRDALRPGMSFRIRMDIQGDAYPVLPEIALQWGASGSYVWTVVDNIARRTPVIIVQRQQGRVLVESDLRENDLVVVEGVQRLRPGMAVEADVKTDSNEDQQLTTSSLHGGRASP